MIPPISSAYRTALLLGVVFVLLIPAGSVAQDSNINLPVADIERRFGSGDFQVVAMVPSRGLPGERTYKATMQFDDGAMLQAKWAPAPEDGGEFNNRPRLEIAAYEFQKLFLDENEYVVPPTVARCVAMSDYPPPPDEATLPPKPTFEEWNMVLVVLQFWLWNVTDQIEARDILDEDRMRENPVYGHHAANFNVLTYLIKHGDSNQGNFVISTDPENPRVFSVDNGISFSGQEKSNRGDWLKDMQIEMLPAKTVERLRALTLEDLQAALGTLAQFELQGGQLVPVEPTENLDPGDGIRVTDTVLQLGLENDEIERVWNRIQDLLEDVDDGDYELF